MRQSKILEQNGNWSSYSKIICFNYSYYLNLNFKTKKLFVQKVILNILLFLFFQNHLFYSKIIEKITLLYLHQLPFCSKILNSQKVSVFINTIQSCLLIWILKANIPKLDQRFFFLKNLIKTNCY